MLQGQWLPVNQFVAAPHSQAQIRKRVGALLAEDRPDGDRLTQELRHLRESEGAPTFSIMLHLLAHLELPDVQAERLLGDLLHHRNAVARALGRDPGLRVAAIDYLSNVKPLLTNPTIVESTHLERTERSAVTDVLTGLGNRRHFSNCLGLEVRRSRRYGLRLSLLLLDLDAFKRLNDRYGHLFGDLVLERVGGVLRRAVREADVACRYGGEEFAVILPETDRLGSYAVAERIRRRIEQFAEQPIGGRKVRLSLSGGIASYPDDAADAARLIDLADEALYLSKHRGKNRISLYHAERRESIRYPAKTSAKVSIAQPGGGDPRRVQALNLSRGGAWLELPVDAMPGATLELILSGREPAGRSRTWVHRGSVVRVLEQPGPRATCRVAIQFDEPLSEECLQQQVRLTELQRAAGGDTA